MPFDSGKSVMKSQESPFQGDVGTGRLGEADEGAMC